MGVLSIALLAAALTQDARAAPAEWVTAHPFPLHYHELFNDLDSDEVFQALHDWLTARFAPVALGRAAPF